MRPEIKFGARSSRQAKKWTCGDCEHENEIVSKLVFDVPVWKCANCEKRFLEDGHPLDFCLGDVEINGKKLIQKLFKQKSIDCAANAMCQVMQMGYMLYCIIYNQEVEKRMLDLNPRLLVDWYDDHYPKFGSASNKFGSSHFYIKTLSKLRREGMPLKDGSKYKIGDVTFVKAESYEEICDELADGNPLLAIIYTGVSFRDLQYCLIYCPPHLQDVIKCNKAFEGQADHKTHCGHAVVLLGPACKGNQRGFYFLNSWGLWCPRFMLDDSTIEHGVAKVAYDLYANPIKMWLPGESDAGGLSSLVDEDDEGNGDNQYKISSRNYQRYYGPNHPRMKKN